MLASESVQPYAGLAARECRTPACPRASDGVPKRWPVVAWSQFCWTAGRNISCCAEASCGAAITAMKVAMAAIVVLVDMISLLKATRHCLDFYRADVLWRL